MTDSGQPMRLGIAGGSFNPVHYGHLLAARAFLEQFRLDQVLLVPSARPPHKDRIGMESGKHRFIMTRMAVCGDPGFEVSGIEMSRPGPSFTVDTIEHLRQVYPGAELYLLLGLDAALQIGTWKEPGQIADMCHSIVIVNRPGISATDWQSRIRMASPEFADKIRLLEIPAVDISSTEIRQRIRKGLPIRYLLPDTVDQYIKTHGLYREESDG